MKDKSIIHALIEHFGADVFREALGVPPPVIEGDWLETFVEEHMHRVPFRSEPLSVVAAKFRAWLPKSERSNWPVARVGADIGFVVDGRPRAVHGLSFQPHPHPGYDREAMMHEYARIVVGYRGQKNVHWENQFVAAAFNELGYLTEEGVAWTANSVEAVRG